MHLWRLWLGLTLFATFAAGAAVIYKWTDTDGVVHFSDRPVPGAEKIVTSSGSRNGIGGPTNYSSGPPRSTPSGPGRSVMAIESPAQAQVFFGEDSVPVRLHLEPGLRPNQSVTWNLNGRKLDDQAPNAMSFSLGALSRGTYTIAATVTSMDTGEAQSTESVTFYVRQPSELAPQHKKS